MHLNSKQEVVLQGNMGSAGFSSAIYEYKEVDLDLNKFLIRHAAATFFLRVKSSAMQDGGISENDILIVDKSLTPKDNSLVVAIIADEFYLRKLKYQGQDCYLIADNKTNKPIKIDADSDLNIWGVVTAVIKTFDI